MKKNVIITLLISLFFISCSSLTKVEQDSQREKLDKMAHKTIVELVKDTPEIEKELKDAVGYAVVDMKLTKIPVFGAGVGKGVLVDLEDESSEYYNIKRVDFGAGWGARVYKILIIINDKKVLEEYKKGKWIFEFGSEASVGTVGANGSSSDLKPKVKSYILANGGVSASITVRVIRVKKDKQLNEEIK